MFSEQENSFLQTIKTMLSPDNNEKQKAEENIKSWAKETYLNILETCNKFIICENLEPDVRRYSCFIMTYLFKEENNNLENWSKVPQEIKTQVQQNCLSLLGNSIFGIRNSACVLVASIGKISLKMKGWPELINTLCIACDSNEVAFIISAIKTLGILWEDLPKETFNENEISLMEKTIIKILTNPSNTELSLISLKAYESFMIYLKNKFQDSEYLQSSLKMLTTYCTNNSNLNLNTNNSDSDNDLEKVIIEAIHRITDISIIAYDYMSPHFKNISEFFGFICNGQNENLAIQGYLFFIEISKEEYYRIKNELSTKNYIQSIWKTFWPCIQNTLNNRVTHCLLGTDEYSRIKTISTLLFYISNICDSSIIEDIFTYMSSKMSDPNPLVISSAIYAFASIIETCHENKIIAVIPSSISPLSILFQKGNDELSRTVAWCFENITKKYGEHIVPDNSLFLSIVAIVKIQLQNEQLDNYIKIHLCKTLYNLTQHVVNSCSRSLGVFSSTLFDLLKILQNLAYTQNSYDNDCNLTQYCFFTISGLLECSVSTDKNVLTFFIDAIYNKFIDAQKINYFDGNKEKMYDYQILLCLCLREFLRRDCQEALDEQKAQGFFLIIDSYFKMRKEVFEEGLSCMTYLVLYFRKKGQEYENYFNCLMNYIFFSLDNFRDAKNCKASLICLINLIPNFDKCFIDLHYVPKLITIFQNIYQSNDVDKEIFNNIILIFSDFFTYLGEEIWTVIQVPLEYMKTIIDLCIKDSNKYLISKEESSHKKRKKENEELQYFMILNENIMDLISNILNKLSGENLQRKEAFKCYIGDIINYIIFMINNNNFYPSKDFIFSCIITLNTLIEIYKENILSLLQESTIRKLSQAAEKTESCSIIDLMKQLQSLITITKIRIVDDDDIF